MTTDGYIMNDSSKKMYSRIYIMMSLINAIFIPIFFLSNAPIMAVINIFGTIIYFGLFIGSRFTNDFELFFAICFIELLLYSVSSTIIIGWQSGFLFYIVGLLPIVYYSVVMLEKNSVSKAISISVFMVALFFATMLIDFWGGFRVYTIPAMYEHIILICNMIFTFSYILGFLRVYIADVDNEKKEIKKEVRLMENEANYDTLTKLLNRRSSDTYFDGRIQSYKEKDNKFSVLMCDIDFFKKFNDTYGHDVGDEVLVNVASTLTKTLRDSDTIFRWGGEEILIVLSGDEESSKVIAERCREAIEKMEIPHEDKILKVTITIGGASYEDGLSKEELLKQADDNLYRGKTSGRNKVVF